MLHNSVTIVSFGTSANSIAIILSFYSIEGQEKRYLTKIYSISNLF